MEARDDLEASKLRVVRKDWHLSETVMMGELKKVLDEGNYGRSI